MKKLIGVFASVALLGSGAAFAQSGSTAQDTQQQHQQHQQQQQPSTSTGAMGGSGGATAGQSPSMTGSNELTGKVVKSQGKKVFISAANGAVVPLDIDRNTQFTDPSLKNAKSLKEGQEIRASFQVKEEKNMATSISLNQGAGTGGSGSDVMSPDPSINEGTGGAGMEDPSQNVGGSGSDTSLNPDTGSSTQQDTGSSPKTY